MSKKPSQQKRAEAKDPRHDAGWWRKHAETRTDPRAAASDRAHAARRDADAAQAEGKQ